MSSSNQPPTQRLLNATRPVTDRPPNQVMLCGYFEFSGHVAWPVLDTLPDAVVLPRGLALSDPLVDLIIAELKAGTLGADAIIEFYAHALFIQVLRAAATEGFDTGLVAALADDRIGRALAEIHNAPAEPWTLERLAARAAMGRTAFAQRFKAMVGRSPMQYLQLWRMQIAAERLATTRQSVATIAEDLGYASEVAFRKAFRRDTGRTPGQVRRAG